MKFSWDSENKSKWSAADLFVMVVFLLFAIFTYKFSPWWGAIGLGILVLSNSYRVRNSSDYSDACSVELFSEFLNYKSLNSDYSVNVKYNEITEIKVKHYQSQSLVIIELGKQSQLKCPNIEKPFELVKELEERIKGVSLCII